MERADHVLVVDDDAEIRKLLGEYLERNGFRVSLATDGAEMRRALDRSRPDIVVLDLMLPGDSGLKLCRDLRVESSLPVIMLTARAEEVDRIVGLEMGADDYLAKPFSPRELVARIRSILRRARGLASPAGRGAHQLRFAGWTLDLAGRQLVAPDGVVVALSGAEFKLLSVFVEHPNRVLDRNQLMDLTVGRDGAPFDRSIDVQVSRLRVRLRDDAREPRIIKTVRNEGYVLAAVVERVS
ncbi:MAG TPA: response regulator [Burkholderiales bacterium]|nr:response regulator [Burkholderiales bacterium]